MILPEERVETGELFDIYLCSCRMNDHHILNNREFHALWLAVDPKMERRFN